MQIEIASGKALAHMVDTGHRRYAMSNVAVTPTDDGRAALAATNGMVLGVALAATDGDAPAEGRWAAAFDADNLPPGKSTLSISPLGVAAIGPKRGGSQPRTDLTAEMGRMPDLPCVVPDTVDGYRVLVLDATLLAALSAMINTRENTGVRILWKEADEAVMVLPQSGEGGFGVLMPRTSDQRSDAADRLSWREMVAAWKAGYDRDMVHGATTAGDGVPFAAEERATV